MALPGGLVTFLFTHIVGSAQVWQEHPNEMHAALMQHDIVLRRAVEHLTPAAINKHALRYTQHVLQYKTGTTKGESVTNRRCVVAGRADGRKESVWRESPAPRRLDRNDGLAAEGVL